MDAVGDSGHLSLDQAARRTRVRIDLASLEPLFRPGSVAVIGASADPTKIGGRPVSYLKASGYAGAIYPVNPNADEIQSLRAYRSVLEVQGSIDLAIFAIPERVVLPALEQCAAKGVRSVVMFSAGFAEVGGDGAGRQGRLTALARESGMRILGPNCLGIANLPGGMVASFSPGFADGYARDGRIGLVSQSGAFGGYCFLLARERGLSFSYWATTGNEADVELSDCLAFLAEDPATTVILAYMEGCRDGAKLREALERARANRKAVVIAKVGRTDIGAAAAASHTAALAGQDAVYDALFRQYGAYRAHTVEELFDVGYACAVGHLPPNDRVGMVTVSGGVGVMMADEASARGLDAAPMPEASQARLRAAVPFAAVRNPVDITGQIVNDMGLFETSIELVMDDGDYGSVVAFQGGAGLSPVNGPRMLDVWSRMRRRHPEKLVAIVGVNRPEVRARFEAEGCLVFEDPSRAIRAVAALAWLRREFGAPPRSARAPRAAGPLPEGPLHEVAALAILGAAGVPVVEARLVHSPDAAAEAARALGFPVALKVVSTAITHKSDVGGVALDLGSPAAVRDAYGAVMARVAARVPGARLEGCVVASMVRGGVETILGVHRDPVFGPVVMFGLGGVFVETLRDVTFRVAPIDEGEAHRMIREIRAAAVLDGVRGGPAADVDALAAALARLSCFAVAHADQLESVDLNPFIVRPRGEGAVAVDAVLVRRQ